LRIAWLSCGMDVGWRATRAREAYLPSQMNITPAHVTRGRREALTSSSIKTKENRPRGRLPRQQAALTAFEQEILSTP